MRIIIKFYLIPLFFVLLFSQSTGASQTNNIVFGPLLWNVSNLDRLKNEATLHKKTYKKIVKLGNKYCATAPVVVTDKTITFAPDNHYYCSVGGYWWEDSVNVGEYVHKDGIRNPLTKDFDASRLSQLKERCMYLSVSFYLTGEEKYYDAFIKQIKAWFIDKDTYMYPNFMYTAVVPGKNRNEGRVSGMIQAYSFIDIIESILLVNSKSPIDDNTLLHIRRWFLDFANWSESSRFGTSMRKSNNNTGLAYDVVLTEMYLFAGEENKAREIFDGFAEKRLRLQIDDEGKQIAELKRSKAFSYSLYNLSHILDYCFIANYWDTDFYESNHLFIDKAYSFLQKYICHKEDFPYQQISEWKECEERLESQLNRRERLRGNNVDVFGERDILISLNVLLN